MPKWFKPIGILIAVVSIFAFAPRAARADDPPGAQVFRSFCAGCHGAGGVGGGAPAIGAAQFLSANDDAAITRIVTEGIPTKGMPAWGKAKGGSLTDDQIASIVAYLRSLATPVASAPAPAPQSVAAANGYFMATKLIVAQSFNANNETVLNVSLQDYTGYPVTDASLIFTRPTDWGVLELGTAKTGANGVASITLAEVPLSAREVAVAFKGDKKYDATATKYTLALADAPGTTAGRVNLSGFEASLREPILAPEGSLITSNPPLMPALFMILVLGSIWSVFGYVLYQVYGIHKSSKSAPAEEIEKPHWG